MRDPSDSPCTCSLQPSPWPPHLSPVSSLAVHPQGSPSGCTTAVPTLTCPESSAHLPTTLGVPRAAAKPKCLCGAGGTGAAVAHRLGFGPGHLSAATDQGLAPDGPFLPQHHMAVPTWQVVLCEAGHASSMSTHLGLCLCLTTCWQLE